jgi:hypothetical protein
MFPRDLLVKAPVRPAPVFNRAPNAIAMESANYGSGCDDIILERILAAASRQRPHTMGEFAQFARPYLNAGYQREVAEAHRRYFGASSQN